MNSRLLHLENHFFLHQILLLTEHKILSFRSVTALKHVNMIWYDLMTHLSHQAYFQHGVKMTHTHICSALLGWCCHHLVFHGTTSLCSQKVHSTLKIRRQNLFMCLKTVMIHFQCAALHPPISIFIFVFVLVFHTHKAVVEKRMNRDIWTQETDRSKVRRSGVEWVFYPRWWWCWVMSGAQVSSSSTIILLGPITAAIPQVTTNRRYSKSS